MVISTFQRGWLLRRSLERLALLTLPTELIIVDDGGEDDTQQIAGEFEQRAGIKTTYIYTHNPGKSICSHGRNIGVKQARYDLIVTSEPELCFRTDVLAQFAQLQPEYPNDVISAGRVWFAPDGHTPNFSNPEWEATGSYKPPSGTQDAIGWVAPYTALWKKEWLMDVGGWDEEFPGYWGWDDIDLLTRLRIMGHGQRIITEVEAVHLYHGLGGDHAFINENHFFAKSFNHGHEKHHCSPVCQADQPDQNNDLIANRGKEWGVPKPRP